MRTSVRHFTRLCNGFSKKAENHAHSVAIHFMHYNFLRIHPSIPGDGCGGDREAWAITDMA
jgi:hypothetical protein